MYEASKEPHQERIEVVKNMFSFLPDEIVKANEDIRRFRDEKDKKKEAQAKERYSAMKRLEGLIYMGDSFIKDSHINPETCDKLSQFGVCAGPKVASKVEKAINKGVKKVNKEKVTVTEKKIKEIMDCITIAGVGGHYVKKVIVGEFSSKPKTYEFRNARAAAQAFCDSLSSLTHLNCAANIKMVPENDATIGMSKDAAKKINTLEDRLAARKGDDLDAKLRKNMDKIVQSIDVLDQRDTQDKLYRDLFESTESGLNVIGKDDRTKAQTIAQKYVHGYNNSQGKKAQDTYDKLGVAKDLNTLEQENTRDEIHNADVKAKLEDDKEKKAGYQDLKYSLEDKLKWVESQAPKAPVAPQIEDEGPEM